MCAHRLDDGPLVCTRDDHPAHPNGHLYVASAGPDLGGDE